MDQDRAIAESDGTVRVRATIFPEDLEQKDKDGAAVNKK
jgi:lipopolysaccharide export system protein LptA